MSSIEWTDSTWNPLVGCSRASRGCDNCYAMRLAHRGLCHDHRGLTIIRKEGGSRPGLDWTGEVRLLPSKLREPLRMRRRRRIFVGSMTDLFHPSVPFDYIAAVFGVMSVSHHTFQVLTKRPGRAASFFRWLAGENSGGSLDAARLCAVDNGALDELYPAVLWPLENVQLGTSVEDQQQWDKRVPLLQDCPAAMRWVSLEPLLEEVSLRHADDINWLVVGGESGPGARPFDVAWAAKIIADSSAPVFVKQIGARPVSGVDKVSISDRKGNIPSDWPEGIRVREWPEAVL